MKEKLCFFLVALLVLGAFSGAAQTPVTGGHLSLGRYGEPSHLDPASMWDNFSIWTSLLLYDQLLRVNVDGEFEPGIAKSWDVSDDMKTYTFHIRDNAKFSDGSRLTMEDIQFSLGRSLEKDALWNALFEPVVSIKALDDHTLQVKLSRVWAPFLSVMSSFIASVVPKKTFLKDPESFKKQPIGSGPFVLKEWKAQQKMVLQKNPHYYDPQKPYLDEITFEYIESGSSCIAHLKDQTLDVCFEVPFEQISTLEQDSRLILQIDPGSYVDLLLLNHRKGPLGNPKVRQALALAMDRNLINSEIYFDTAVPANTYLPQMRYWNPYQEGYIYSPQQAKALLKEAGYEDGFSITFTLAQSHTLQVEQAKLIQKMWKEVGVDLKIRTMPYEEYMGSVEQRTFEVVWFYVTADIPDPDLMTVFEVMSESNGGYIAPTIGYQNEEVDGLASKASTTPDGPERQNVYTQLQQIIHQDAPFLPLFYLPYVTAMQPNVNGFQVLPTGNYRLWEVWKSK